MSYGRPALAQVIAATVSDTAMTVTLGNPDLRPQVAKNIDLKLEYYFKETGLVSIAVYQKEIKDYILSGGRMGIIPSGPDNGFEGSYAGYSVLAPFNAGDADLIGFEFDYRQRLTFLPGLFKGLMVTANYTYLETEGNFGATTGVVTRDVAGFVPRTGNARLIYTYKRFGASVVANFTGRHIRADSPVTPLISRFFRRDLTTINVGFSYKIRPAAQVYVDVNNIFEEGPEQYRYISSRTRQQVIAGRTINFGVSGQF
jgi:TonB-dependent receptor